MGHCFNSEVFVGHPACAKVHRGRPSLAPQLSIKARHRAHFLGSADCQCRLSLLCSCPARHPHIVASKQTAVHASHGQIRSMHASHASIARNKCNRVAMVMEAQAVSCDLCLHRQEEQHPDHDVCSRSGLYQTWDLCGLTGELVQPTATATCRVVSLGTRVADARGRSGAARGDGGQQLSKPNPGGRSFSKTEVMIGAPFSLVPWRVASLRSRLSPTDLPISKISEGSW